MSVRNDSQLLFNSGDLQATLDARERDMLAEIDGYDGDLLLNTTVDDLCRYFAEKYRVEPLAIQQDGIQADHRETKAEFNDGYDRQRRDRTVYVPATAVSFSVPFTGDPMLLHLTTPTHSYSPPRATVAGSEVVFSFVTTDAEPTGITGQFEQQLRELRQWIDWGRDSVDRFNRSAEENARQAIAARRARLLAARKMSEGLGYPLRPRAGAASATPPVVRRKVLPTPPRASAAAFEPEPVLDAEIYEHILAVLQNMALVMERNPTTFRTLDEEGIRQHFLVQLNGHYEGEAIAEAFNGNGKTDILIRSGGRNVFIAECKFWKGPEGLKDAIDQLLGYATWRDAKLALLLFNRLTNFSTVLQKVPEVLKGHPNFKRSVPVPGETRERAVLRHPSDSGRELTLTVLAFEVPA